MKRNKTVAAIMLLSAFGGMLGTTTAIAAPVSALGVSHSIVSFTASEDYNNGANTLTIHPQKSNAPGVLNTTGGTAQDPSSPVTDTSNIKYELHKLTAFKASSSGPDLLANADFSTKEGTAAVLAKVSSSLLPGGKTPAGSEVTTGNAIGSAGLSFSGVDNGIYLLKDVSTDSTHVKQDFWVVMPLVTKQGNKVLYEKDVNVYPKVPTIEMAKALQNVETNSDGTQTATFRITVPVVKPADDGNRSFTVIDPLPAGLEYVSANLVTDGGGSATGVTADDFTFSQKNQADTQGLDGGKMVKADDIPAGTNIAVIEGKSTSFDKIYSADNAGKTLVFDVKAKYVDNKDDSASTSTITNTVLYVPNKEFYRGDGMDVNAPKQAKTEESHLINVVLKKVNAADQTQTISGVGFNVTQGECGTSTTLLKKYDKADGSISGALNTRFTTGADGTVEVLGLPEKTNDSTFAKYCLSETNTVAGFKTLAGKVNVTVTGSGVQVAPVESGDTSLVSADGYNITVQNPIDEEMIHTTVLGIPLTGSSMELAMVGGPALLALMAGFGIVAYRRKQNAQA